VSDAHLRTLGWVGGYLALALAPVLLTLLEGPPGRGWWLELAVGLGFLAFAVLCLQLVLTARFARVESPFGLDAVLHYHRHMTVVAAVLVLAHPAILIAQDPGRLDMLNPVTASAPARWGLASAGLLLALIVLSVWRRQLRLPYEVWRVTHGLLAVGVVATGLVHVLAVGHHTDGLWGRAVWIAVVAGVVAVLVYVRLVKPWRLSRRPYTVDSVERLPGEAWRLTLRPEGHRGLAFRPGQFAWLRLGVGPLSPREHPFSLASSVFARESPEFIIREAGDFTSRLGELEPGTRALLDGPYGAFSHTRNEGAGFVFIAGGVGIAPILGMLRSLADVADPRPMTLLYANRTAQDRIVRDELEELTGVLDLTIVEVLEDPPSTWEGERGTVGEQELLARHLPSRPARYAYLLCGPPPMLEAVSDSLERLGVPPHRIDHEQFDLV